MRVNDIQSQLNATRVHRVLTPRSEDDVRAAIRTASEEGRAVSIAGGRHSMGGQQFGEGTILLDTRRMERVLHLDRERGLVEVEAGIQWPALVEHLHREQAESAEAWGIRQKQTGVDAVTLGGALASNVHGRGLRFPPIVDDVESFVLVDAEGRVLRCSRSENPELFSLAIGGYGLFGVITRVTLRLARRTKLERVVEVIRMKDLVNRFEDRLAGDYVYGDCQFSTDLATTAEEHRGVLSCYRPVDPETPMPTDQRQLSADDWKRFYGLARSDKRRAFAEYSRYYLSTSGQVYWSDRHQLAGNFEQYREAVDPARGTEVITEVYVPMDECLALLAEARQDFLAHDVDMTYGTIRLIEPDTESFLAWAREPLVCIVCNLHVLHTPEGKRKVAGEFRRLIDRAIEHRGRFFLTYHRWATRGQVEACYPAFADFLRLKRGYDPEERFQSDWYRHYRDLFFGVGRASGEGPAA